MAILPLKSSPALSYCLELKMSFSSVCGYKESRKGSEVSWIYLHLRDCVHPQLIWASAFSSVKRENYMTQYTLQGTEYNLNTDLFNG